MWSPDAGPPSADFLAALYGEDSEDEEPLEENLFKEEPMDESLLDENCLLRVEESSEEDELDDKEESDGDEDLVNIELDDASDVDENDEMAIHTPSSPPYSPLSSPRPKPNRGIVTAVYGVNGEPIDGTFVVPDSHEPLNDDEWSNVSVRGSARGGRRGRDGRRGQSGRRGRMGGGVSNRGQRKGRGRHRLHSGWQPGQPLQEVYVTDDDVPREVREMARDAMRRRQIEVEAAEARRVNERARVNANAGNASESEDDDEFINVTDGRDNSRCDGMDRRFEWFPMETFRGVEEPFVPERTGSVLPMTIPYDAFRSFWDDDILKVIVDKTNLCASRIPTASFKARWYPTNVHEVLCLFAFWMMIGIHRMPTIDSCFSTSILLKTEIFSRITTLSRYKDLNRALHFVDTNITDSACPTTSDDADPMHCLRPIFDHLNSKFKSIMSKDICIDESLTLWKGNLKFKQYIQSKTGKFGIKTFELCESRTGYLWSFQVYTGKRDTIESGIAKSASVVLQLVEPLLNKGHRLFMDNWFNSPLLARILKRNGTDCVGTLRSTCSDVPKVVTHAPLTQGQLLARHSGDVCVLSWMDKKRINMISTCHGSAVALGRVSSKPRRDLFKPHSILDYNRSMGGVDLKDQMLEPYLLERKRCSKWYLKLFKRMLNCSIHNARVLMESSLQARQDNLQFRLRLVQGIFSHHRSLVPVDRKASSTVFIPPHHRLARQTHWPVRVQQKDIDRAKNKQTRLRCVVCYREGRKSTKSPFQCESCNVPLCVEGCFKKFHVTPQQ